MPGVTYFVQECPTCGRRLQIRVDYLGKRVGCRHCGARFDARDPASALFDPSDSSTLLARADELLEAASSGLGVEGTRGYTDA